MEMLVYVFLNCLFEVECFGREECCVRMMLKLVKILIG